MTKPPFLKFRDIESRVAELFEQNEGLRNFPVDIETFIECDLGLEIIPIAGLRDPKMLPMKKDQR